MIVTLAWALRALAFVCFLAAAADFDARLRVIPLGLALWVLASLV